MWLYRDAEVLIMHSSYLLVPVGMCLGHLSSGAPGTHRVSAPDWLGSPSTHWEGHAEGKGRHFFNGARTLLHQKMLPTLRAWGEGRSPPPAPCMCLGALEDLNSSSSSDLVILG